MVWILLVHIPNADIGSASAETGARWRRRNKGWSLVQFPGGVESPQGREEMGEVQVARAYGVHRSRSLIGSASSSRRGRGVQGKRGEGLREEDGRADANAGRCCRLADTFSVS